LRCGDNALTAAAAAAAGLHAVSHLVIDRSRLFHRFVDDQTTGVTKGVEGQKSRAGSKGAKLGSCPGPPQKTVKKLLPKET